jgi:hypothetical protein
VDKHVQQSASLVCGQENIACYGAAMALLLATKTFKYFVYFSFAIRSLKGVGIAFSSSLLLSF